MGRTHGNCKPLRDLSYTRLHALLAVERGAAAEYVCVNFDACENLARHWAHRHDTDRFDFGNYDPMCISCHRKYDDNQPASRAAKSEAMKKLWATGKKEWLDGHITL
jgi:hypothetical protein